MKGVVNMIAPPARLTILCFPIIIQSKFENLHQNLVLFCQLNKFCTIIVQLNIFCMFFKTPYTLYGISL